MGPHVSRFRAVAPANIDQRGAMRHPVKLSRARVRKPGRFSIPAELIDLSIYGARLACEVAVKPEELLWLQFDTDRTVGIQVIWASDGQIGCRFDQPIARDLLIRLVRDAR